MKKSFIKLIVIVAIFTSLVLVGRTETLAAGSGSGEPYNGINDIGIDTTNLNKLLSTNNNSKLTANMWDTLIGEIKHLGDVIDNRQIIMKNITSSPASDTDQIYEELNDIYSLIKEINITINQLSGKSSTSIHTPPTFTYYEGGYDKTCDSNDLGVTRPSNVSCTQGQHVLYLKKTTDSAYTWYMGNDAGNNYNHTFKETMLKAHDYCRLAGVGGIFREERNDKIKIIGNQLTLRHIGPYQLSFAIACLDKEIPNVVTYPPTNAVSSLNLWSKWKCDMGGAPKCPSGYRSIGTRGSTIWDGASCGLFADWDERYCVKENVTMVANGGNCIAGYSFAGTTVTVNKGKMNNGRCIATGTSSQINMDPNTGTKETKVNA